MLMRDEDASEPPRCYAGQAQAFGKHAALKADIDQYAGAAFWPCFDQQGIAAASTA
jgi:hypothetical protein